MWRFLYPLVTENYTRFYVLQHSSLRQERVAAHNALIRVSPTTPKPRPDLSPLLDAVTFRKTKILPRPSLAPIPFHDVYFIQVECVKRGELEDVKRRVEQLGWSYTIMGMF
jgi:prephenate dehydratase